MENVHLTLLREKLQQYAQVLTAAEKRFEQGSFDFRDYQFLREFSEGFSAIFPSDHNANGELVSHFEKLETVRANRESYGRMKVSFEQEEPTGTGPEIDPETLTPIQSFEEWFASRPEWMGATAAALEDESLNAFWKDSYNQYVQGETAKAEPPQELPSLAESFGAMVPSHESEKLATVRKNRESYEKITQYGDSQ